VRAVSEREWWRRARASLATGGAVAWSRSWGRGYTLQSHRAEVRKNGKRCQNSGDCFGEEKGRKEKHGGFFNVGDLIRNAQSGEREGEKDQKDNRRSFHASLRGIHMLTNTLRNYPTGERKERRRRKGRCAQGQSQMPCPRAFGKGQKDRTAGYFLPR